MRALVAIALLLLSFAARADALWASDFVPATGTYTDNGLQIGTDFNVSEAGWAVGVRYYASSSEAAGTHVVTLFTQSGTLLATGSGTTAAGPGWVSVLFNAPVKLAPGTNYSAVRHRNETGSNAVPLATQSAFSRGALNFIQRRYLTTTSTSAFPTSVSAHTNYVDIMYTPQSQAFVLIPYTN